MTKLSRLELLDLQHNRLNHIPSSVCHLKGIEQLLLDYNNLRDLPSEIGELTSLNKLSVANNHLTEFPAAILQLRWIFSDLDLSGNALTSIPSELINLVSLRRLMLCNNQLTSIPKEVVSGLVNLEVLSLGGNPLLFLFDADLHQSEDEFSFSERINSKYTIYSQTECRSKLAAFCQAIHNNATDHVLQQAFHEIHEDTRHLIIKKMESLASEPIKDSVFANKPLLVTAIMAVVKEQWNGLDSDQQTAVYQQMRRRLSDFRM